MTIIRAAALIALALPATPASAIMEPATRAPAQQIPGVSDAGNAIAQKVRATAAPQLAPLVRQQNDARGALVAQINADKIDMTQVENLIRQLEKIATQARGISNTAIINTAKAMNEADRKAFLHALLASAPAGPAQPR